MVGLSFFFHVIYSSNLNNGPFNLEDRASLIFFAKPTQYGSLSLRGCVANDLNPVSLPPPGYGHSFEFLSRPSAAPP